MKPKDVQIFISHDSEESELAHRLAHDLGSRGFSIWIAPESIQPGESWVDGLNRGLEESTHFVVLLTPQAIDSRWVRQEVNTAIALERDGHVRLIPLDVKPCDLPALWSGYQWISFQNSYTSGFEQLVAALVHESIQHTKSKISETRTFSSVPPGVSSRAWSEIDTHARLYDALYSRLPGDLRNYVLNSVIVDQVFQLGSVVRLPSNALRVLFERGTDGARMISLLMTQTSPSLESFEFALEAIQDSRSPFEQFHGLRAIEVMIHLFGKPEIERLIQVLEAARQKYLVPTNHSRWQVYQNILRQLDFI